MSDEAAVLEIPDDDPSPGCSSRAGRGSAAFGRRPRSGDRAAVDGFLEGDPPPGRGEIDAAFWQACHGGQRRMAEYLLARGADVNAIPDYAGQQTALEAAGSADTQRQNLVDWLKERGAAEG